MTRPDPQTPARMAHVMERRNEDQIWRDEFDDMAVSGIRWLILFFVILAVVMVFAIGRALAIAAYYDVNLVRDAAAHGFDIAETK